MDMLPVEIENAERLRVGSDEITILANCAQSGGSLFAVQIRMQPGGGPPVMHRHSPGEVYHVLEGEFTFYIGDPEGPVQRVTASAGQVMPLAGGTAHTIRNESDAEAVAFVVHAPGRPMEEFSRAAAALATDGSASMAEVLTLAARHGIEMLGPVPA